MRVRIKYRHNPEEVKANVVRTFRISLFALAMISTALVSALIAMRLAIHGREVEIPNLSGHTLEEASEITSRLGLNLTIENRFYSTTTPSGRVLSQSPEAGTRVRSEWHVRVTESLGPQRVSIPDTLGQNERDAAMAIRRQSLDLGTLAHLPAPGDAERVLAQTPPPNAEGIDKPQVSLLLSQPESAAQTAYVMPNLVGLTYSAASARMTEMGVRIWALLPAAATTDPSAPPPQAPPSGIVQAQLPAAGRRISPNDTVRVTLPRAAAPPAADPTAPSTVY